MKRLESIQVLRAIAALLVVVDHIILAAIPYNAALAPYKDFAGTMGRMGVNVFFVISGLIMVHTTRQDALLRPVERSLSFMKKRLWRLVPLYWIATAAYALSGWLLSDGYTWQHIVTSLLFLPNFADTKDPLMFPVAIVGWTLNYEMYFYMIFAICLLLPRKIVPYACMAVICAIIAGGSLIKDYIADPALMRAVAFYTFKNIALFAVGIAIGLVQPHLPAIGRRMGLLVASIMMAIALGLHLVGIVDSSTSIWQPISLFVVSGAVILSLMDREDEGSSLVRMLGRLGDASFSIYLFHVLLIDAAKPALNDSGENLAALGIWGFGLFLGAIVMGRTIYETFEAPVARKTRHFTRPNLAIAR